MDSRFLRLLEQMVGQLFAAESRTIAVVPVVGRQDGVLAGTNGMMAGLVVAAATQTSNATMVIAPQPLVEVPAVEAAPSATQPGEKQAEENEVNQSFRDGFHIRVAELPRIANVDSDSERSCQLRLPCG
jgi:hypothetical protein